MSDDPPLSTSSDRIDLPLGHRLRLAQEIARLVRTRLPLEKALSQLSGQAVGSFSTAVEKVNQRLQAGQSLSNSLARGSDRMTRMLAACIELGELSKSLDRALELWAAYQLQRQRYVRSLASALVYPFLLVVIALVCILHSAWKLLPQYELAFVQLVEERPSWLGTLSLVNQYFGYLAAAIVGLALFALWRTYAGQRGWDRLDLPRNLAQRSLHYQQIAELCLMGIRSGKPVSAWLPLIMSCVGVKSIETQPAVDLSSPNTALQLGQETSSVLSGLATSSLSQSEAESLLVAISENCASMAELQLERQIHRWPMLASLVVGAVGIVIYLCLIYLPWIALFQQIAAES